MRLEKINPAKPWFYAKCVQCGARVDSGTGFADMDEEAFKSYYCPACAKKLRRPIAATCWPRHRDCDHRRYIGRRVTLAGAPATVTQTEQGNARIAPDDPAVGTVPYSWAAVWNICDNHGGKFD